jgi:hypothetical protein
MLRSLRQGVKGLREDDRGIVFTLMVLFLFFVGFGLLFLLVYPMYTQVGDTSIQMGTPQEQVEAIDRGFNFIPIGLTVAIVLAGFIAALKYEVWQR